MLCAEVHWSAKVGGIVGPKLVYNIQYFNAVTNHSPLPQPVHVPILKHRCIYISYTSIREGREVWGTLSSHTFRLFLFRRKVYLLSKAIYSSQLNPMNELILVRFWKGPFPVNWKNCRNVHEKSEVLQKDSRRKERVLIFYCWGMGNCPFLPPPDIFLGTFPRKKKWIRGPNGKKFH